MTMLKCTVCYGNGTVGRPPDDFYPCSYCDGTGEAPATDTDRLAFLFNPHTKRFSLLPLYLKGMHEKWTLYQWRNAIDEEMKHHGH